MTRKDEITKFEFKYKGYVLDVKSQKVNFKTKSGKYFDTEEDFEFSRDLLSNTYELANGVIYIEGIRINGDQRVFYYSYDYKRIEKPKSPEEQVIVLQEKIDKLENEIAVKENQVGFFGFDYCSIFDKRNLCFHR